MEKLGLAGEQDVVEKIVKKSDPLAAGILKILRVQRRETRSGAKMLGVFEHGLQQGLERACQALGKSGSQRKDLVSLGMAAPSAQFKRFVQRHTEHRIAGFKRVDALQIGAGFIPVERNAPVRGYGTVGHGGGAPVHRVPPVQHDGGSITDI